MRDRRAEDLGDRTHRWIAFLVFRLTGALAGLDAVVSVDAMARSFVLPFGPLLLLSLLGHDTLETPLLVSVPGAGPVPPGNPQTLWAEAAAAWGSACAAYFVGRAFAAVGWSVVGGASSGLQGLDGARSRWLFGCVGVLAVSMLWTGLFAATPVSFAAARFVCGASGALACRLGVPVAVTGGEAAKRDGDIDPRGRERRSRSDGDGVLGAGTGPRLRATHAMWVLGSVLGPLVGGLLWRRGFGLHRLPALLPCLAAATLACLMVAAQARGRRRGRKRRLWGRTAGSGDYDTISSGEEEAHLLGGGSRNSAFEEGDLEVGVVLTPVAAVVATAEPADAPAVPNRYLRACGGRANKAERMWEESLRWRQENDVDSVLREPQPNFRLIKECYPHFLHGRSRQGEIICYENPGKMDFGRLASLGVGADKMQRHYCFVNDYIWGRISPGDDDTLMTVLDIGGLSLATLKGNTVMHRYLAATAEVMQKHYPERQSRIMIVNAPWWFASVYRLAAGILSPNTAAKLIVSGTTFLPALLEHVDIAQIPREYGGQSSYPLGQAPEEAQLLALVNRLDAGADEVYLAATPAATAVPGAAAGAAVAAATPGVNLSSQLRGGPTPPPWERGMATPVPLEEAKRIPPPSGGVAVFGGAAAHGGRQGLAMNGAAAATAAVTASPAPAPAPTPGAAAGASGSLGRPRVRTRAPDDSASDIEEGSTARTNGRPSGSARAAVGGGGGASASTNGGSARVIIGSGGAGSPSGGAGSPSGGGGSGGVMSRLSLLMGLGGPRPPRANLGLENRFTYDQARQMWVLEGEAEEAVASISITSQREEQVIVEAIQAAHYKKGLERMARAQARAEAEQRRASGWLQLETVIRSGEGVLAAIAGLFVVWCGLQATVEVLLPLWMLSSAAHGGLHLSPSGVGWVLAAQWLLLGALHRLAPLRVLSLPAKNPLRAVRVGAVIYITAVLLLHVAPLLGLPASESPAALAVAVTAAAAASSASALARSAAGLLLQVALRGLVDPSVSQVWLAVAAALGEATGPWMGAIGVAFAAAHGTSHPMDATFGLNLAALVALVSYVATLLLQISTFGSNPRGGGGRMESPRQVARRQTCQMVEGLLGVPVADVGGLFEDMEMQVPKVPRAFARVRNTPKRS